MSTSPLAIALRAAREAKGLNQTDLANIAGVSQQVISSIENGRGAMPQTLLRLNRALGVNLLKYIAVDRPASDADAPAPNGAVA